MVISERQQPGLFTHTILRRTVETDEAVAFCPACKTFETVPFSSEGLGKTRRFIQEGDHVFHLCGATEPCRLLRKI